MAFTFTIQITTENLISASVTQYYSRRDQFSAQFKYFVYIANVYLVLNTLPQLSLRTNKYNQWKLYMFIVLTRNNVVFISRYTEVIAKWKYHVW